MLVSVITVVRNEPLVVATVESVLAQKGLELEYIVIDGASTDGTLQAMAPYKDRIRLISEPDKGIYDAMNKGLRLATGRVVGFLNAGDVFVGHDNLAAMSQAFLADPGLGACFSDLEIVDGHGRVVRWWPAHPYRPGAFATGWTPSHPTFYALREKLLELGGFDTRYSLGADFDLMMKYFEIAHMRAEVVPRTLVRMRSGGSSQSSLKALWTHNHDSWASAYTAGLTRWPFIPFMVRRLARKIPQLFRRRKN